MTSNPESSQRARSAPVDLPPILVWHPDAEAYAERLRELLPGVRIDTREARRVNDGAGVPDAPVLLTWRPPGEAFARMPSLRWIHAAGAGVDHLLPRPDLREDVILTRSVGRFGEQVAEYVIGYLLALLLELEQYRRDQDRAVWRPRPRRLLTDLTVGILGLGHLGEAVARRLGAIGADVLAARRKSRPTDLVRRVYARADWRAMLRHCDALVVTLPSTEETRGMLDLEALDELPEGAILVNVARGDLVPEEALLEALRTGRLGAAVLDAFAVEPLPAESPLWTEPNAWITPHVAAPSEVEPIASEFAANYRRFTAGEEMAEVVDRSLGY